MKANHRPTPFLYEARSPDEFLAAALAGGMEPTYARCVHNVFMRTAGGSLGEAVDASETFVQLTGEQPTRGREYAENTARSSCGGSRSSHPALA